MKNIEKIAIDSMIEKFQTEKAELIQGLISAKSAAEIAQQNFKKAAGPVLGHAKEIGALLAEDEISEEATKYFEGRISEILNFPFAVQKA